jgi:hypothetical protein
MALVGFSISISRRLSTPSGLWSNNSIDGAEQRNGAHMSGTRLSHDRFSHRLKLHLLLGRRDRFDPTVDAPPSCSLSLRSILSLTIHSTTSTPLKSGPFKANTIRY